MNDHGRSAEPEYAALTDAELLDYVRHRLQEAFGSGASAATPLETGGVTMYPICLLQPNYSVMQGA